MTTQTLVLCLQPSGDPAHAVCKGCVLHGPEKLELSAVK